MASGLIDVRFFERIRNAVRWVEQQISKSPTPERSFNEYPPLIGGYLLEDLKSGEEADMAVLKRLRSTQSQIVSIVGFHGDFTSIDAEDDPGSFRLRWSPTGNYQSPGAYQESGSIRWDASTNDVYNALLKIFGRDEIEVHGGDPENGTTASTIGGSLETIQHTTHLGRWIVVIKRPGEIPLMRAHEDEDDNLRGYQQAQVTATSIIEDSGRTEKIYGFLPCGSPTGHTPMRRGSFCVAGYVQDIGYCPVALEPRDFFPQPLNY